MVKKYSVRKGFTLVEALTSMLIISIFFAIMAKTMTTRSSHELSQKIQYHHGYYECYNPGGYIDADGQYIRGAQIVQKHSSDTFNGQEEFISGANAACRFKPVVGTEYAIVYAFTGATGINNANRNNVNQNQDVRRSIRVYKKYIPQLTADEIAIPRNDFGSLPTNYLNLNEEDFELNYDDFINFVRESFPTSYLVQNGANWRGPGIFICW